MASDGKIEINQAMALAVDVTPNDAAGFPIEITQPGSFVLTGNLEVSNPDTTAIDVQAIGVTVDLNGFTLASR